MERSERLDLTLAVPWRTMARLCRADPCSSLPNSIALWRDPVKIDRVAADAGLPPLDWVSVPASGKRFPD